MAKKLIEQEEAARFLGLSVDDLNSLRDRGKLFPKRDAGIWKYDQEDLERYQRELAEGSGVGFSWETGGLDEIQLEDNNGDPDSVLLSEAELGESAETAKSTIIGKQKNNDAGASDIRLAGDSDLKIKVDEGTKSGIGKKASSDDLDLLSASSDLNLADSSPKLPSSSGLFDDEEFSLEPIGSGKSSTTPSGSFKLDDDVISLGDSDSDKGKRDESGDTRKGAASSGSGLSGIELGDDDELVLSGHESDITLGAADSGIQLVGAGDSGLALDSGPNLGGIAASDELTIGEDDMITLEESVDLEGATQLRSDEDFSLTPTGAGDDDSDSGSQVIALDAEDDMSTGSLFGNASSDSLLADDSGMMSPLGDAGMAGAGAMAMGAPMMMPTPAAPPEAPFSVWNVLALLACTVFMMLSAIMAYDLTMQMWSFNEPAQIRSDLMDSLLKTFSLDK
jgi:hypothetical protein